MADVPPKTLALLFITLALYHVALFNIAGHCTTSDERRTESKVTLEFPVQYVDWTVTEMEPGVPVRACERSVSGAENGAERAENGVSGSGAVSGYQGRIQDLWSGGG